MLRRLPHVISSQSRRLSTASAPAAAASLLRQDRVDLAAAYRLCHSVGFAEGVCNHLTMEVAPDRYLLVPHGLLWSEVGADDLLLLDADGNILEGRGEAEISAFYIHRAVHQAQGEAARCVFHTHMPHATALTVLTDNQLPMVHQNCLKFFGEVASYDRYHGLVHDGDEASRIVDAFGSARCLMMANHGVIVTGETAAEAFDSLYYLEQAAKLVTIAMSTGRPLRPIDPAVCAATAEAMRDERPLYARRHFDALRRTMLRGQDYGQCEGEDLDASRHAPSPYS